MGSPKPPAITTPPPPPTPAQLQPPKLNSQPNLGGTYLTAGITSSSSNRKPGNRLLGE